MCGDGVVALWNVPGLAVGNGPAESHHGQRVAVAHGDGARLGQVGVQGVVRAPEAQRVGPQPLLRRLCLSPVFALAPAGLPPTAIIPGARRPRARRPPC